MILLVKNSKGGVGKSTITKNLASGLSKIEYKTAIVSFDYQNGSLTLLGREYNKGDSGFKALVSGKDETVQIKIGEIDYYPLEDKAFSPSWKKKLIDTFEMLRKKYDFVLIDGAPNENYLNDLGVLVCDKILVPVKLDKLSIEGVVRLIDNKEVIKKLAYIVPNLYNRRKTEKTLYENLKQYLAGTDIFLSNPILDSGLEADQADKGKTIFDTKSKSAEKIQGMYIDIIEKMLGDN